MRHRRSKAEAIRSREWNLSRRVQIKFAGGYRDPRKKKSARARKFRRRTINRKVGSAGAAQSSMKNPRRRRRFLFPAVERRLRLINTDADGNYGRAGRTVA